MSSKVKLSKEADQKAEAEKAAALAAAKVEKGAEKK